MLTFGLSVLEKALKLTTYLTSPLRLEGIPRLETILYEGLSYIESYKRITKAA